MTTTTLDLEQNLYLLLSNAQIALNRLESSKYAILHNCKNSEQFLEALAKLGGTLRIPIETNHI